ncbi:MAG: hypothetical protein ACJAR2_004050 [Ilumatobacter sp.]|jgi:hypothetical protein
MSEEDEVLGQNGSVDDSLQAVLGHLAAVDVTVTEDRLVGIGRRITAGIDDDRRSAGAAMLTAAPGGSVTPLRRFRSITFATAAACVVVFAAVTVGLFAGGDDGLVIAAADDVVVELPDGVELIGRSGTELPDGSRVDVIGFVTVDGVTYGPGSYEVTDGQIMIAPSRATDTGVTAPTSAPGREGPVLPTTVVADTPTVGNGIDRGDEPVRPVEVTTTSLANDDRPIATDNAPHRTAPSTRPPEVTRPPTTGPAEPEPTGPPASVAPEPEPTRLDTTTAAPTRTTPTTVRATATTVPAPATSADTVTDPVRAAEHRS